MTRNPITWIVLIAILLAGCGDQEPGLLPLPPDGIILAYGDSLTYGSGVSVTDSYPAVLASLIRRQVVRSGVPGETSAAGLARLPAVLQEERPDLLILCHGGNDMIRKLELEQLRANLEAMIEAGRAQGADVLLVAVPKPGLLRVSIADVYREVAEARRVPLVDDVLADILGDPALKSDPIHPNEAGYRRLAEAIADELSRSGAI